MHLVLEKQVYYLIYQQIYCIWIKILNVVFFLLNYGFLFYFFQSYTNLDLELRILIWNIKSFFNCTKCTFKGIIFLFIRVSEIVLIRTRIRYWVNYLIKSHLTCHKRSLKISLLFTTNFLS